MKFCLSSRQTPEYLAQADEIRVLSRDINQLYDLLENYKANLIYNLENLNEVKETLIDISRFAQNRITLALYTLDDINFCKEHNFPYYYIKPINNLSAAKALKNLGVNQLLIDAPLTHMMHKLKLACGNLPIRLIPVFSYLDNIPREDGVGGNWVRPEDLPLYDLYITTIDFGTQPQKREQALFRIYAKEHQWPGDLGRLVIDLNYLGVNRMLRTEDTAHRLNCEQKCVEGKCNICYNLLNIAQERTMRDLG